MAAPIFQVTMRSGPTPGKTFLLEKEETSLGRDLANDISISDPEVSRRHARFVMQDDNIFVEDLGSTNGTFLNGERISAMQQLRAGDVITFGENIVLVFEKTSYDPDATVVSSQPMPVPTPEPQPVPAPQPVYQQPAQPREVRQPVRQPAPRPVAKKKKGFPVWLVILIIAIVVAACVIGITLYFMPASWWCTITFNMLEGCPIQ
jgi:pSer/pThr/pTyr-binding forkhead associated (FHA) protein